MPRGKNRIEQQEEEGRRVKRKMKEYFPCVSMTSSSSHANGNEEEETTRGNEGNRILYNLQTRYYTKLIRYYTENNEIFLFAAVCALLDR